MKTKKSKGKYTCLKTYLNQESDHCFVVLYEQSNVTNVLFVHAILHVFSLIPVITCTVSHCAGTDTNSCMGIPECIIGQQTHPNGQKDSELGTI